ncbi:serine hydrolase domain-containing protein [Sphingobium sp. CECT 9361]|uniref:serine hydrolase domain-containing protein n=1 Tax=Sphingobium sp. CECT 9361 TaxID=2845384 RepID=UPI001E2B4BE7|nr:serine hydrolase domain-containing protein [Sphingobium sp. CECT 9361]CAH0350909.1 D-aminopeptidase [Sphingobium sp. CECT 9361]
MSGARIKIVAGVLAGGVVLGLAAWPWRGPMAPAVRWPIEAFAAQPKLPLKPSEWHGKIDYRALDSRIRALMHDPSMTGLTAAVVEDGRLSFVQGYGLASTETGEPVDERTTFRWASLSKGVAGTLSARLAEDGVFSLSDPVGKFPTSLRLPGDAQRRLTLEQLLSQRTGLPKNAYDDRLEAGQEPVAIRQSLAKVADMCPPGTCHSYQNVAYDTISEVIGASMGKPYGAVANTRLFQPLGMFGASVGLDGLVKSKNWARPHRGRRILPVLDYYYRVPAAAGVNSTIVDLARWMQAQMGLARDMLPSDVLATIQTPRVNTPRPYGSSALGRELKSPGYGLGMRSFTYKEHRLVGHSGAVAGYRSAMMFDPTTKTGIVLLWNSESSIPWRLQPELFDMAYGLPFHDWLDLKPGLADKDVAQVQTR